MKEDHWWGHAYEAGGGGVVSQGKVQARVPGAGLAQADVRRDSGSGTGKMAGGGGVPPSAQ